MLWVVVRRIQGGLHGKCGGALCVLLRDGFHIVHFVSKLTSFSTTFDTKNGKMDCMEWVINRGIVNTIRRGSEFWEILT